MTSTVFGHFWPTNHVRQVLPCNIQYLVAFLDPTTYPKIERHLWAFLHAYLQNTLISLGYVDFWPKVYLIFLYPSPGNLATHITIRYRWAGSLYSVIILTTFSKQSNYLTFFYHNHFWRKNSEMNHYYWESLKRTCNEENEFSHFCWKLFMHFFFSPGTFIILIRLKL